MKHSMKRLLGWLMAIMMLVGMMSTGMAETVYTGEAKGFAGQIKVEVSVDGGAITGVSVVENNETQGVGTNAIAMLPGRIVETQSIAVDSVSGCTVTSEALLAAVKTALEGSGLDMEKLMTPPAAKALTGEDKTVDTDVVVVGAGLAGLTAAIRAQENGADVILLEKMSFTGGNSKLSSGAFFLGGTEIQAAAGVEDTPDLFYDYIMEKSGGKRDPIQVRAVADMGNDAIKWLMTAGIQVSDEVSAVMGCPVYRVHHALPNAPGMIDVLTATAKERGIELLLDTPATELIVKEDGAVAGVKANAADGGVLTVNAKKVILAAGGFGADPELLKKYWGLNSVGYAGVTGTTGEMIVACLELGADTMDISEPWLSPTIEVTTNTLMTSGEISKGAILVTSDGKRFTNEPASYMETSQAVYATGEEVVYEIFDSNVKELQVKVPDYIAMGVVTEAATLEELAAKIGLPAENLIATVETYNAGVRGDAPDPFGREIYGKECNKGPYYSITVRPGTIMTPGGLKVNEKCEVIKTDGTTIPNLYAIGEMTGGYRAFGYIGGDSLSHCLVSGLIAANDATK